MNQPIPQRYVGVWRRSKLRRGTSPWDLTTRVYWLQTPWWHADIRVPANRPDFSGVRTIRECSDAQLAALLEQEAFCGVTSVEGEVCRWFRQIDYRLRDTDDFGRMVFAGNDLEEIGIATDYYELWHRLPDSVGPSFALTRIGDDVERRKAYLCVAGEYFVYMRDRALPTSPAVRIRSKIALGSAQRDEIESFLDFEASFGRIVNGQGVVELSTLPWREGALAFETGRLAAEINVPLAGESRWRLIEGSGDFPLVGIDVEA